MDNDLPTRFREVESLFTSMRKTIHARALKDGLNRQERAVFEDCLHQWFWRFARRPGSGPVENLRPGLVSAAERYARSFKGIDVEGYWKEIEKGQHEVARFKLRLVKPQEKPPSDSPEKQTPKDQEKKEG